MLSRSSAALVVIDFQDKLFQAMHDKENLLVNAAKVIKGARVFDLPLIVTEQIPEKLGQTIPDVIRELGGIERIAKESFSCWGNDRFQEQVKLLDRRDIIIIGIESHICVYQTTVDLLDNGYNVHIVADAVSSRTKENSDIGLAAMRSAGARITGTEMVLFEILRAAGNAGFKDIQKIVK
ncbi:MAG: hydrolase [Syntrophaceae bacterium]|nr:hydrolase [Syntrophaceae bacterium]